MVFIQLKLDPTRLRSTQKNAKNDSASPYSACL